jgi:hypothetical protein
LTGREAEVYDPMGMATWRTRAASRLSILCLVASLVRAATPPLSASGADAGLLHHLDGIETAFRAGDATGLRLKCGADRVRLDLADATRESAYGPGQVEVIFGRIFEEFRTTEFSFRHDEVREPVAGTAFARGRWARRPASGGAETRETLTFTLRREGAGWRVQEIRSSRNP